MAFPWRPIAPHAMPWWNGCETKTGRDRQRPSSPETVIARDRHRQRDGAEVGCPATSAPGDRRDELGECAVAPANGPRTGFVFAPFYFRGGPNVGPSRLALTAAGIS